HRSMERERTQTNEDNSNQQGTHVGHGGGEPLPPKQPGRETVWGKLPLGWGEVRGTASSSDCRANVGPIDPAIRPRRAAPRPFSGDRRPGKRQRPARPLGLVFSSIRGNSVGGEQSPPSFFPFTGRCPRPENCGTLHGSPVSPRVRSTVMAPSPRCCWLPARSR